MNIKLIFIIFIIFLFYCSNKDKLPGYYSNSEKKACIDSLYMIKSIDNVCSLIHAKRISNIISFKNNKRLNTDTSYLEIGNKKYSFDDNELLKMDKSKINKNYCKVYLNNIISDSILYNFNFDKDYKIYCFSSDSLLTKGLNMRENKVIDKIQINLLDSIVKVFAIEYKIDLYGEPWVNRSDNNYFYITYYSKPLDKIKINFDPYITFLVYKYQYILEIFYGA